MTKGTTTALPCNIYLSGKRQHTGSTRAMVYLLHDPCFEPWAALFFGHISLLYYLTVIKTLSYSVTFSALQACK